MANGSAGTGGTQSGSPASSAANGAASIKGGGISNGNTNQCVTVSVSEYRFSATFLTDIVKSE